MSGPETAGGPPSGVWPMYRAMVGVGLLCGLAIVSVYQVTLPTIERNKAEALQRAIFQVLPAARSSATYVLTDDGQFVPADDGAAAGVPLYIGRDEQGGLVGFAIPAQGMGYQDVIRVLYGYSADVDAVVGLRVLESKETPGLGDRIESDPDFVANFTALDAALGADGTAIANPIRAVKNGQKKNAWEVDGITGATISSVAIADLLRESTLHWVPLIRSRQDDFREAS